MSSSQKGKLHFLVTGSALGTTSQAGICASGIWNPRSPFSYIWAMGPGTSGGGQPVRAYLTAVKRCTCPRSWLLTERLYGEESEF